MVSERNSVFLLRLMKIITYENNCQLVAADWFTERFRLEARKVLANSPLIGINPFFAFRIDNVQFHSCVRRPYCSTLSRFHCFPGEGYSHKFRITGYLRTAILADTISAPYPRITPQHRQK